MDAADNYLWDKWSFGDDSTTEKPTTVKPTSDGTTGATSKPVSTSEPQDYSFSCDASSKSCSLALADGTTFVGFYDGRTNLIQFRGIRYADAERWKPPV